MGRFALGFLVGVAWSYNGPGSLRFAQWMYDRAIAKEDRREAARSQ